MRCKVINVLRVVVVEIRSFFVQRFFLFIIGGGKKGVYCVYIYLSPRSSNSFDVQKKNICISLKLVNQHVHNLQFRVN